MAPATAEPGRGEHSNKYRLSIGNATETDDAAIHAFKTGRLEGDEYHFRHNKCFLDPKSSAVPHRLSIELLSTCFQVHEEAALLPLMDNTFSFQHGCMVRGFVNRLVPLQQRAITSIILVAEARSILAPSDVLNSVATPVAKLRGVNRLRILATTTDEMHSSVGDLMKDQFYWPEASLRVFEKLPLTSVSICVTLKRWYRLRPKFGLTPEMVRAWAQAAESRLLQPWDEVAYRKSLEAGKTEDAQKQLQIRKQRRLERGLRVL